MISFPWQLFKTLSAGTVPTGLPLFGSPNMTTIKPHVSITTQISTPRNGLTGGYLGRRRSVQLLDGVM